jgi:hypothetical protein
MPRNREVGAFYRLERTNFTIPSQIENNPWLKIFISTPLHEGSAKMPHPLAPPASRDTRHNDVI